MLDVCGIAKDVLLLTKEHFQGLQFMLRQATIGEPAMGNKITAYDRYRKKLKKETIKCLKGLKWMKSKAITLKLPLKEQNLTLVLDVLREVKVTSISMVESLLSLICSPQLDQKSSKRSFASRIVRVNVQSLVDVHDETVLRSANKRLEGVGMAIEDLEEEMECMFRCLIHTRVLLLNLLTN